MSKSTKSVRTIADIENEIAAIRQARKDAKIKFQADLDQRFIDYRKEVADIRTKRAALFAELDVARKAEKSAKKQPKAAEIVKKPAKKAKAVKKAA